MAKFEMSEVINRPVEEVFRHVTDLDSYPKWHSSIVDTRRITDGPIGVGSKWTEVFRIMGIRAQTILEITEYEPNSRVVFQGTTLGPVEPNFVINFDQAQGATKVSYIVEPKARAPFNLLVSLFGVQYGKRDLRSYLTKLKQVLEGSG